MRFEGKVALVTGAASGIGRSTALAFAGEGAPVALSDTNTEGGEATAAEIRRNGGEARFFRCDVGKVEEVRSLVAEVVKTFGRLDTAFNNAGIEGVLQPVASYPESEWLRVISVNLNGVFFCMRQQIAQMLAQGGGAIINNASILGQVGFANASAYAAAKHGVIGLTRSAAIEYAAQGIRINAVCPGFITTPMLERAGITRDPALAAQVTALHPMKRLGEPREVAEAVLFLASPAASFITGHPLLVDGGYVAQ